MKNLLTLLSLVLFSFFATAQTQDCQSQRYQEQIFSTVKVTKDIKYGEANVWSDPAGWFPEDMLLDFYEPAVTEEYLDKRPLVVMMFGGGFVVGNKGDADVSTWCDSLARLGYACASINYRLDNAANMAVSSAATVRAAYRAIQDARAAIRYLIADPDGYGFFVDTDHIYTGGESAGAITAIHTAYLEEIERPGETYGDALTIDLGCLDCSGNDIDVDFSVAGIIDLWGGTLSLDMIDQHENVPMLIIHGTEDDIVLFDTGKPFLNFYPTFPVLFGALPMHTHMDNIGIYNEFYPYEGEGHVFYGIPAGIVTFPNELWDPVWNQGKNFLYTTLQFDTEMPSGNTEICQGETITYTVPLTAGSFYCWEVDNGTIVSTDNNEITVSWDAVGTGELRVTEETCIDVVGTTRVVPITIHANPDAAFTFVDNNLDYAFNGSVGTVNTWDFGDGNTGTGAAPIHSYAAEGDYTVSLTVADENGCSSTSTQVVAVRTCYPPTGFAANFVGLPTGVGIKITWTHANNNQKYQVRYRIKGTTSWSVIGATPGNDFKSIANLEDDNIYQYQVRTFCGVDIGWSTWSGTHEFFFESCDFPENITITELANGSTRIAWDANLDASKYQVRYRNTASSTWTTVGTFNTYKVLAGLTPGDNYFFRVRSLCQAYGPYSLNILYSKPPAGARLSPETGFNPTFYPNPATNAVFVEWNETSTISVDIQDVAGRSLIQHEMNDGQGKMDISKLNPGVYFISISNQNGKTSTDKLIVR